MMFCILVVYEDIIMLYFMQKKRRKDRDMEKGLNSLKHKDADFSYGIDNLSFLAHPQLWLIPSQSLRNNFLGGNITDSLLNSQNKMIIVTPFSSVQFSSVAQSCLTLCDPMNRSTPGLPVHHQLPEFTQTHIHRVSDAIQPSHPLSSPSPLAPNPSQHQNLFQWVNSLHEVAKVLEFQL